VERTDRIEENLMQQKNNDGRDELNLAEFPLCALSRRLRPDQKTLHFEDRLRDKGRNEWITRQLTITGSDAFGLPTMLDDEVLLGLIQLTRQRDFADRKVPFTRHELLRLLDWRDDSKNYHRLEASLNRWTGVTLYYKRAWWNKARQCWVDEKFHVLDNVWLCHRGEPYPDTGLTETGAPVSAFVWNETIFRSFQSGNLKSIDFEFFKSLESGVAKRLYRFLDKRFWHRHRCEFKLREFACQHIGLAQTYDTSNLKRKLLPGVLELEARGYLVTMSESGRFRKLRAGEWLVSFEKGQRRLPSASSENDIPARKSGLTEALLARGVSSDVAAEVCAIQPVERIHEQLEVFDWLLQRRDPRISRNPAGFLVSSIRDGYAPPKGFKSLAAGVQGSQKGKSPKRVNHFAEKENSAQKAKRAAIGQFWRSLTEPERARLESEAVANASKIQRDVIERGGPFAQPMREVLLDAFALKMLSRPVE
jgi:hypothetical protein